MRLPQDRTSLPARYLATPADPTPVGAPGKGNLLEDGIQFLRRHAVLLAGSLALGVLAGFAHYVKQPRTYRALATLELLGLNETFIGMNSLDPQAGTGTYSANTINLQTQLKLVESPRLRRAVYDKVRTQNLPGPPAAVGLVEKLRRRLKIVPISADEYINEALFMASDTVTGGSLPGTRILVLGCESTNPEIAAAYVNELAIEYINQNVQTRAESTLQTGEWLRRQLAESKAKLEIAEKREQEFVRKFGGAIGSDPETLDNTKLKQLQMDLSTVQAERITKQAKYDMLKNAQPNGVPDDLESAGMAVYQTKIGDLRRERAALLTTLTPEHPRVKQVDAQIEDLQASLNMERQAALQKVKTDYESSLHKEQLLRAAFSRQSYTVSSQSDRAAEYGMLKREADMLRSSVTMLSQQANQSAVVSAVPMANVRVVDPAEIPTAPIKPSAPGEARLGVTVSLALGIGLGFAMDKFKAGRKWQRFSMPGMAPSMMQVPELGVIPAAGLGALPSRRNGKDSVLDLSASKNGHSWKTAAAGMDQARMADAIQNTLVSILHQGGAGSRRILLGASPGQGEGKTTMVSNLALAVAKSGRRVLLIDADLRRPQLHHLFNMDQSPGLSDVLRCSVKDSGSVRRLIRPTPVQGLFLLPSGASEADEIAMLFLGAPLGEIMSNLRNDFDLIVVDTPPLLQFAETRLIGRHSDGVLLVLRSEVTEHEAALSCQRVLAEDGIPLIGTILNHWKPQAGNARYYTSNYYTRQPGA